MLRADSPNEPVISANECNAALRLMSHMARNIIERGEVSEELVQLLDGFSSEVQNLSSPPTGKEGDVVGAAMWFLPTFPRDGATREIVGARLFCAL
jgi:hypothetical protein